MSLKEDLIKKRNEVMSKPFEVEHGIPVPARNQTPRSMYPFGKMEIGDSFKVAVIPGDVVKRKMNRIGGAANAYRRRGNMSKKFTCRHVAHEEVIRVWRIE